MTFIATFSTEFDADNGKIILFAEDEEGVASANFQVRFGVTGPAGLLVKAMPTGSTFDMTFGTLGDGMVKVSIPVIGDAYVNGTYTVTVEWRDFNVGAAFSLESTDYYYEPTVKPVEDGASAVLAVAVDRDSSTITATDSTPISGWDVTNYLLELETNAVADESTIETDRSVSITGVTDGDNYTASLAIYRQKFTSDQSPIVVQEELVRKSLTGTYSAVEVCDTLACVADAVVGDYGCNAPTVSRKQMAESLKALFRHVLATSFAACGDKNKEHTYASQADCDCGCNNQ